MEILLLLLHVHDLFVMRHLFIPEASVLALILFERLRSEFVEFNPVKSGYALLLLRDEGGAGGVVLTGRVNAAVLLTTHGTLLCLQCRRVSN